MKIVLGKNVLVLGGSGQLGMSLREASRGSSCRYIFSDITSLRSMDTLFLDITDPSALSLVLDSERVDVVINCAAYTNVDKAEDDTVSASKVNYEAVASLGKLCAERNIPVVHISTDMVFDGMRGEPYSELSQCSPLNVYGRTKNLGEVALAGSGARYLIIRTSWLYSPWGKNFLLKVLRESALKERMTVVGDQIGSPTYAMDLAELLVSIVEKGDFSFFGGPHCPDNDGILHYSDEGVASWYDLAVEIVRLAGITEREKNRLPRTCKVFPCRTSDSPRKAVRPPFSVLDKSRIKELLAVDIPHWRDSLERCIRSL